MREDFDSSTELTELTELSCKFTSLAERFGSGRELSAVGDSSAEPKSGFSTGGGGGDFIAMGEAIGIDLRATGKGTGDIELFIWFK